MRWLLRSTKRHAKRVVLMIDSKVAVGAISKGRSGSVSLNFFVRRVHCLCMAGGLRLHLLFVPTEHNPGDYPSRGVRLPGRRRRRPPVERCPECGVSASEHPACAPKRLRGQDLFCSGAHMGFGYAFVDGDWVSQLDASIARRIVHRRQRSLLRCSVDAWRDAAQQDLSVAHDQRVARDLRTSRVR